jgi:hypothetical protein
LRRGAYHKLGIQRYWRPRARVSVIASWKIWDREDGEMLFVSRLMLGFGSSMSHAWVSAAYFPTCPDDESKDTPPEDVLLTSRIFDGRGVSAATQPVTACSVSHCLIQLRAR